MSRNCFLVIFQLSLSFYYDRMAIFEEFSQIFSQLQFLSGYGFVHSKIECFVRLFEAPLDCSKVKFEEDFSIFDGR